MLVMAGLLKNQILKPLSKFVKNLSPDKIKISAIKGEGDLTNLELDEDAIMELLDLPTWLLLNKVTCNKVSIKIQWTRIKSQPIFVYIDKVFVEIEVLEEPRPLNSGSIPSYRANSGKYGLIDRVIDGIKVSINSVKIVLKAAAFKASLELSRLMVSSKLPNWKDAELKFTSIRDSNRNSILLFKEIYWETTRIEADALQNLQVTPVKLITNTSRIRITLKKRLSDCAILTSRVQLLLDDLLWVLTVSQMEAAVLFLKSLQSSILKSSQQSKAHAQEKIKRQVSTSDSQTGVASQPGNSAGYQGSNNLHPASAAFQHNQTGRSNNLRRLFDYYDVQETSYHLYTGRVELHFCEEGQEGFDRSLWSGYADFSRSRDEWLSKLRKHQAFIANSGPNQLCIQQGVSARVLMESVFVLRMNEIQMSCVSTSQLRKQNDFLGSDRASLNLPPDTNTLFLDYTEYYYSDNSTHQVPAALLYCQVNPFHLRLDFDTLVWLNAFYLNLSENLEQLISLAALSQSTSEDLDLELLYSVEATLPRIILPPECEVAEQPDRPDSFQIQASSIVLGNILPSEATKQDLHSLQNTLEKFYNIETSAFFRDRPEGEAGINWKYFESTVSCSKETKSTTDTLLRIQLNQIWIEFVNSNGSYLLQPRTQYFLDSVNMSLWLLIASSVPNDTHNNSTISVLVDCAEMLALRLDHYQLLYLYRLIESMTKLGEFIADDSLTILLKSKVGAASLPTSSIALAYNLPLGLGITFVMPAISDILDPTANREAENDTPGSLFQLMKENTVVSDPLDSIQKLTHTEKNIARASYSIPLVSAENAPPIVTTVEAPLLVMSAANHSDTELNAYYNTKEINPTNIFTSNSRYSQSTSQLSPPTNSSTNSTSRLSSPVMRGGRRTPTSSMFTGTFNQSVNRLGSTFSKFGGKLKATITPTSGNSSNYGDEDCSQSEDWEQLSMAGSEFSDSDDERLIAMMTADLELDQGYAPGGVAQGIMHPNSPGQFATEIGRDASCLMDGEESCISSLTNRSRNNVTVAFRMPKVNLYMSSTSQTTKISITATDCTVEESARCQTLESDDELTSKKCDSVVIDDLLIVSCDIPAIPSDTSNISKIPVSQTNVYLNRELTLNLLMSSLVNLADLFEDEILPQADIPFSILRIVLDHPVCLKLTEDRPCTNLTCPGDHQKVTLRLRPGMQILRDRDGVLDLLPPSAMSKVPEPTTSHSSQNQNCNAADYSVTGTNYPNRIEVACLTDSDGVTLDDLTVVSCYVNNNRHSEFMKDKHTSLQAVKPSLCSIACQTSPCDNKEIGGTPVSTSPKMVMSSSTQCNIVSSSPSFSSNEITISSTACIASSGNFSSLTPSQELLAHYYTENVKLREKITCLRRERGHLAEQLAGCRQALEDSAREKQFLGSHSYRSSATIDYHVNSSNASSSVLIASPPSVSNT